MFILAESKSKLTNILKTVPLMTRSIYYKYNVYNAVFFTDCSRIDDQNVSITIDRNSAVDGGRNSSLL